jgi:hypothetical protein
MLTAVSGRWGPELVRSSPGALKLTDDWHACESRGTVEWIGLRSENMGVHCRVEGRQYQPTCNFTNLFSNHNRKDSGQTYFFLPEISSDTLQSALSMPSAVSLRAPPLDANDNATSFTRSGSLKACVDCCLCATLDTNYSSIVTLRQLRSFVSIADLRAGNLSHTPLRLAPLRTSPALRVLFTRYRM